MGLLIRESLTKGMFVATAAAGPDVRDAELIAALQGSGPGLTQPQLVEVPQAAAPEVSEWNHERIYRVYKAMQFNLRCAAQARLPKRELVRLYVPRLPDTAWSANFIADALACGPKCWTSTIFCSS